jgi:hypothetical protein
MFTALVDLAFVALFDVGPDGATHPFPIHSRPKSLFKTCCPRMLQVVVIPSYCTILKILRDDKFAILTENLYTVD